MVFLSDKYHLSRVISSLITGSITVPTPTWTPADLSPASWFQLSTQSYKDTSGTPAVIDSGDTIQELRAVGDATKYYRQANTNFRPLFVTEGGKVAMNCAGSRRLKMAGTSSLITQQTTFSYSIWLKCPASGTAARHFFSEEGSAATNPNAGKMHWLKGPFTNDNYPRFTYGPNAGTTTSADLTSVILFDDTWHHFVWTDNNGSVSYYVDNVKLTTTYTKPNASSIVNQAIGASARSEGTPFPGFIGNNIVLDTKIWTQDDVTKLFLYG